MQIACSVTRCEGRNPKPWEHRGAGLDIRIVGPENPSLSKVDTMSTGCHMRRKGRVQSQPVSDGWIKPEETGGRVFKNDNATSGSNKCQDAAGAAMQKRRRLQLQPLTVREVRKSSRMGWCLDRTWATWSNVKRQNRAEPQ